MIRPIETYYAGVRFRSRLEARWALFFDELDIPWEYEPECFRSADGELYLPDFRIVLRGRELHETSEGPHAFFGDDEIESFAEVKPHGGDFSKAIRFRCTTLPLPFEQLEGPPPGHPKWMRVRQIEVAPGEFWPCPWPPYVIPPPWNEYGEQNVLRAASVACSERFGAHP